MAHDDETEILAARPHLIADVVDEDIVPEVRFAQLFFENLRVPRTRLGILAEFVSMSLGRLPIHGKTSHTWEDFPTTTTTTTTTTANTTTTSSTTTPTPTTATTITTTTTTTTT